MIDSGNGRVASSGSRRSFNLGVVFVIVLLFLLGAWVMNTGGPTPSERTSMLERGADTPVTPLR
jgi:hypothetical protein